MEMWRLMVEKYKTNNKIKFLKVIEIIMKHYYFVFAFGLLLIAYISIFVDGYWYWNLSALIILEIINFIPFGILCIKFYDVADCYVFLIEDNLRRIEKEQK